MVPYGQVYYAIKSMLFEGSTALQGLVELGKTLISHLGIIPLKVKPLYKCSNGTCISILEKQFRPAGNSYRMIQTIVQNHDDF